jgi:hypothetical protein
VGRIAKQYGVNGNFSGEPLFCDRDGDDLRLNPDSPCVPGNHPDGSECELIGALGVGCGIEVPVVVEIEPRVLNPRSRGSWITSRICMPENCDPGDIDVLTVMLNETVPAEPHPAAVHGQCLMMKFARSAVIEALACGDAVEVRVTGEVAGETFAGADTIGVLCKVPKPGSSDGGELTKPGLGLFDSYISPFTEHTVIRFDLPEVQHARLTIHDVQGRLVRDLVDEILARGSHSIEWDRKNNSGHAVPSGVYFVCLKAGPRLATHKVVLAR